MKETEISLFYNWATQSDAATIWYGDQIPSFKKFINSWKPHYFNDSNPELGRCFVIQLDNKPIGQINYNTIFHKRAEIDILIADSKNWGKGYGSDAIRKLIKYLFDKFDLDEVWVAADENNTRGIKAYQKAGMAIIKPFDNLKDDPYWANKSRDKWVFLSQKNPND